MTLNEYVAEVGLKEANNTKYRLSGRELGMGNKIKMYCLDTRKLALERQLGMEPRHISCTHDEVIQLVSQGRVLDVSVINTKTGLRLKCRGFTLSELPVYDNPGEEVYEIVARVFTDDREFWGYSLKDLRTGECKPCGDRLLNMYISEGNVKNARIRHGSIVGYNCDLSKLPIVDLKW